MQIIEKPWEKANLGVDSVEYLFDREDKLEDIDFQLLENPNYNYKVCRVPAGRMDIMYKLQDMGFQFSETTIEYIAKLKDLELPAFYQKRIAQYDYHQANKEREAEILELIGTGLYDNDRIALDPYFGIEYSARRFRNWLHSELERGTAKLYDVTLKGKPIGYFSIKHINDEESLAIQAALYDKKAMGGIGFAVLYFPMLQAKREGKKRLITAVSSNNEVSTKTHFSIGFQFTGFKYVLIKHEKPIR